MKKILLAISFLLTLMPAIQAKDKEEVKIVLVKEESSDNYYYEGVVTVEGVSKEDMYKRAKEWVLSNFKTGDANAQFDQENLTIFNSTTVILDGSQWAAGDMVNFKFKVSFKDGRYKFRFDNLVVRSSVHKADPVKPYGERMWPGGKYDQKLINKINQKLSDLAAGLEKHIKSQGGNDW